MAKEHVDDEIMYDQDPKTAAARTGHAWTKKLNSSNLTFVLFVQYVYLRII